MKVKCKLVIVLVVIFLCLLVAATLAGCDLSGNLPGGNIVPVYKGMTISDAVATVSIAKSLGIRQPLFDAEHGNTDNSGNHYGWYKDKDNVDQEEPFGEEADTIEDVIDSTLNVTGSTEEIYYAVQNQDVFITIHIENPDSYEIISFTLNGKTYSSYMFEYGSDMENIILKVNVGNVSGVIEYTIDAIKYVDGTEIKDVLIGGDQTVRAGVSVANQVKAIVQETVSYNSLTLNVKVLDEDGLVAYSQGSLKAVLYNGEVIVDTKELIVGETAVTFDDLTTGGLYQYAIIGYYDNLIDGFTMNLLYKNALFLKDIVVFDNIEVGQERIDFDFSWDSDWDTKYLKSLTLTHGEEVVELDDYATFVEGLLSNNEYLLTAYYENGNDNVEAIYLWFTTRAKAVPTVAIIDIQSTQTTISFDLSIIDSDEVGEITTIELLNGETIVQTTLGREFTSLDAYTLYTLRVTYAYDLNDGEGEQTLVITESVYTLPIFELNSTKCINTDAIFEGDKVVIQISINNPFGATASKVKINGDWYKVSSSVATNLYIEIVNEGQFDTGEVILVVEAVEASIGNRVFEFAISTNNIATCIILGDVFVQSIKFVDGENQERDMAFIDEQLYALIMFHGATGYDIVSVLVYECYNTGRFFERVYTSDVFQRISSDTILIPMNNLTIGNNTLAVSSFTYSHDGVRMETKFADLSTYAKVQLMYRTDSDGMIEISSADDLRQMNGNYHYKLVNDIDLQNENWSSPANFNGYFNGNGFAIKNMHIAATFENEDVYLGLFKNAQGIIENLRIENIYIDVIVIDGNCYFGGVAAHGDHLKVRNVTTSGNVTITCVSILEDNDENGYEISYVGGFVGYGAGVQDFDERSEYYGDVLLDQCVNKISLTTNCTYVGGLVGGGPSIITNSYNAGNVSGSDNVGGLIGMTNNYYNGYYTNTIIENSFNTGIISGTSKVGGLVGGGYTTVIITNSYNSGSVRGTSDVGGLVGYVSYYNAMKMTGCYNIGIVSGTSYVGGLVGSILSTGYYVKINNCYYVALNASYSFVGSGLNSSSLMLENCYHVSNGTQGIKASSIEELIEIMRGLWDEEVWDFENTIDLGFPTLK